MQKINEIFVSDNIRYNVLNAKIRLKLYSEIVLCSNMIVKSSSKEEVNELKKLISDLNTKISILEELTLVKKVKESNSTDNNLFFLTTESGNVIVLESLRKNVPVEYYESFKELILSIKNGTFKGLKNLNNKAFLEVKDFKVRIIFDILSNGNYIIIDAFMKKEDTSVYYRNMLNNRNMQYLNSKNYYLKNMDSPEFITKHNDYYNEVLTLLESKEVSLGGASDESRTI